jgi:hypothetical protein
MGEGVTGSFRGLGPERVRLSELFADLEQDCILVERHSLPHLMSRLKHLKKLAAIRVADLTSRHFERKER